MAGTQEQREQLSIEHPWQGQNRFIERMLKVPYFHKIYRARIQQFSGTIFKPERIFAQVDALAPILRPAVVEEGGEKLERFDLALKGETLFDNNGRGGQAGQRRQGPSAGIKPIKQFVDARSKSLSEQLAGKSGGVVVERGFGGRGR
jgi:hypothetical protein